MENVENGGDVGRVDPPAAEDVRAVGRNSLAGSRTLKIGVIPAISQPTAC